jgi:HEAT repeat protein
MLKGRSDEQEESMSGLANDLERTAVADIHDLIAVLTDTNPVDRKHAREALVSIGKPALDPLIRLLNDHRPHVRWEAVKALGSIGDQVAVPALVGALEDEDGDVRWLAAEGLIDFGLEAVQPLLSALACRSCSSDLLESAHHVLCALNNRRGLSKPVKSVLAALNGTTPRLAIHLAAYRALNAIRAKEHLPQGGAQ